MCFSTKSLVPLDLHVLWVSLLLYYIYSTLGVIIIIIIYSYSIGVLPIVVVGHIRTTLIMYTVKISRAPIGHQ